MQTYAVSVQRRSTQHAVATTRDFSLTLGLDGAMPVQGSILWRPS